MNSLPGAGSAAATMSVTEYLGARIVQNIEVYADPELAWGNAPGSANGTAGYIDGDLTGQPRDSADPYFARAFVRWRIPMRQGKDQPVGREDVGRAPNVIAGQVPQHRLIVTAGKVALTDLFDVNSFANNSRTQFINNAFVNNLAYDYAEDSRGYDYGAAISLVNPTYAIRFGTFAMPVTPGGDDLRYNLSNSHSEQLELDLNPQVLKAPKPPMTVRLLAYENTGNMGPYANALAAGMPPDLSAVRTPGTVRVGFGLNVEQALGDGGATGIFGRLGVTNGSIETAGFAEADTAASLGAQISGARWKRGKDIAGIAIGSEGIGTSHRLYLADGGLGFNLGDGGLTFGSETDIEAYYMVQWTPSIQITGDVQVIDNPGYNRDRGPATVFSLRLHKTF